MKNVYAANIYVSYSYKTKFLLWERNYHDSFYITEDGFLFFVDEKDAEDKFRNIPYVKRLNANNVPEWFCALYDIPKNATIDSIKIKPLIFVGTLDYLKSHMSAENFLEYYVETQKKFLDY